MSILFRIKTIVISVITFSSLAWSHPTSYKEALGVMVWNQPWLTDLWTTYSFRADMAFALRYMRMEMPDGRVQAYIPQFDLLLKRWNEKEWQANIYAYTGYGKVKLEEKTGSSWLGGIEVDAESTKYFVLAKAEWMTPTIGQDLKYYQFRLGVAPYEAEFNELASWFMVQYEYHDTLTKKQALTPLARFFYRSVLWEIGVSLDGDYMANIMFHF